MKIQDTRLVICGTARNVADHINDSIESFLNAFQDFKEVKIVICESFSTDTTLNELVKIEKSLPNFTYFVDKSISLSENRRTVRIASARNQLLQHIRENLSDFDYVAMVDLDGVNRDLRDKQIRSVFEIDFWDAAFANQPLRYYDIWALRAEGWNEGDCWKEYQNLLKTMPSKKAHRIAVTSKMKSISEKSQPICVESAFGGLGIYRTAVFLEGFYSGMDDDGNEICEHVHFHETLTKKGYRLFIMPSLVNLNRRSQILNILKESILRATKRIN